MSKPVQLHPARSPARAKLATAIAERDRIKGIHDDRKARADDFPVELFDRQDDLEARIRSATSPVRGQFAAYERAEMILAGEEPDNTDPTEALRAELSEVLAEIEKGRKLRSELAEDVHALANALMSAEGRVREAAAVVMTAEGGRAALIAEHTRLAAQVAILARAIDGAASPWISGNPKPHHDLNAVTRETLKVAPCPWAAAAERLHTDPDAPMPTIAAALAAVVAGSPARNAA